MADQDSTIGADAWGGKSVSASTGNKDIPLSSDMPPLSGKSVTSVPVEHRFDRVPPPMTNTNPEPAFPKPGEALDNAMRRMADPRRDAVPEMTQNNAQSPAEAPKETIEQTITTGVSAVSRDHVLSQVKSGIPAAIFDDTVIPLIDNGMVRMEFAASKEGIRDIVAVSTKDNQPIRVVGYARGSEGPKSL